MDRQNQQNKSSASRNTDKRGSCDSLSVKAKVETDRADGCDTAKHREQNPCLLDCDLDQPGGNRGDDEANTGSQEKPEKEAVDNERVNAFVDRIFSRFAPPAKLTYSQWAESNVILPDYSAEPGPYRIERVPYMKEPMDCLCDPNVRTAVWLFAARTTKSQGLINILGYHIDQDPAPILMIRPTVDDAQDFSKERIAPFLEDVPVLAAKISEPKSRESSNTILHKKFPGGYIVMVGANAPRGLRSWDSRIILCDEVDGFPASAGNEGDPIALATIRATTFWNSKVVISSTPTVKGESRIETAYENSTQEQWCVSCPSCGEFQPYDWQRLLFPQSSLDAYKPGHPVDEARPLEPEMACAHCGVFHTEWEWKSQPAKWIARRKHDSCRGFHINAMASPFLSWQDLVDEFLDAVKQGPEKQQVFINTRLAELWEGPGERVNETLLEKRRHYYDCDVPDRVVWLTAGVDVQKDRLEAEVVGWGPGGESWGIEYVVIPGDFRYDSTKNALDEWLKRTYMRDDGVILPISCVGIDSGYNQDDVLSFCRTRMRRGVFAVRGEGGYGKPIVGKVRRQGRNKDFVFPVGTDSAKDLLFSNLSVDVEGPGYCHYPIEAIFDDGRVRGYDEAYFKGLLSERREKRRVGGQIIATWVKSSVSARNEPLDTRVYASAALKIMPPDLDKLVMQRKGESGSGHRQIAGTDRQTLHKKRGWRVIGKSSR